MAPATASSRLTIDEYPEVVTARRACERIAERRTTLEGRLAHAHRIGGYTNVYSHEPRVPATAEEILLARQLLEDGPRELTAIRIEELRAERALSAALTAAKAEILRTIDDRRREKAKKLNAMLTEAARVNSDLLALDEEAQRLGLSVPTFSWHELLPETPIAASRLASWRKYCREHGALD